MNPEQQSQRPPFTNDGERAAGHNDPVIEDFHSFFEKLNALDDLSWSSGNDHVEPEDAPGAAPPASPPPQAAPPAPVRPASAARRPRMNVLKSETAFREPVRRSGTEEAGAGRAGHRSDRLTVAQLVQVLKMTLVSLILFGLGLGAGWAALSLPGRFEQNTTSYARVLERGKALLAGRHISTASRPALPDNTRIRTATGTAAATGVSSQAVRNAGASTPAGEDRGRMGATVEGDATEEPAGAEQGVFGEDIELPTASGEAAGVSRPAQAASAAPGEPAFSLQVGACSSFRCVESYRKILLGKVGSRAIKVVKQPLAGGERVIQRIRIEPLGRTEGESLRAALIGMDPRFKGAYLLALH